MIKSNDAYEACQEKLISVQKQLKKTQQELKRGKGIQRRSVKDHE